MRTELLGFGGEYAWLDVACLRQDSEMHLAQLKAEEWQVDVPTIGNISISCIIEDCPIFQRARAGV